MQLVQLQKRIDQIRQSELQVVGISYDPVSKLAAFAQRSGVTFPLLSDAGSHVIRAYGLEDKDGYPHPGSIVIDGHGVVRATLFMEGYRERHDVGSLIEAAAAIE